MLFYRRPIVGQSGQQSPGDVQRCHKSRVTGLRAPPVSTASPPTRDAAARFTSLRRHGDATKPDRLHPKQSDTDAAHDGSAKPGRRRRQGQLPAAAASGRVLLRRGRGVRSEPRRGRPGRREADVEPASAADGLRSGASVDRLRCRLRAPTVGAWRRHLPVDERSSRRPFR